MKPHLIIWAALFLFSSVSLCSVQSYKHIEISKFPFTESIHMASPDLKYYRLDLTNAPKDLDLTISAFPETNPHALRLFVSHHKEFPQNPNDADYPSRTLRSGSIVFIRPNELKMISTFLYIGLLCQDYRCKGNIGAEWSTGEIIPNHFQTPSEKVHKLLSPNVPFYGAAIGGPYHYFEALLVVDSPTTISIQSDAKFTDLYISTDPSNKYPNQDSFTYTTKTSITLTLGACGPSKSSPVCSVYIAVFAIGAGKESHYLISLRPDFVSEPVNPAIALGDGRETQEIIPTNHNIPSVFYYTASQNSIVKVKCPGREIAIYARRIKVDMTTKPPKIEALNKDNAEFSSIDNQNHIAGIASLYVPLLADSKATIVAVSVYFNEVQPKSLTTIFTILASSQITQLFAGTPYSGSVAQDHYVYFMVPFMRSESTLLVSLTNLDDEGDVDLVISYGTNIRPTISEYQFASISASKAHVIEINNTDISPMSGNWIIGVYGQKASSFTLAAAYEDQKMIDLIPGTPIEMPLNESANLKFFHNSKTDIQIVLTKFSGELNLYVTSLDASQNLASNLPDSVNHKWQISHADSQSFINIPAQDPQACVFCLYIIKIEAIRPSIFRLIVNKGYNFVPLQDGVPYFGQLRPEESAPFLLRPSKNAEEAELRVETKGSELEVFISSDSLINITNYLWKETVLSDGQTISLKKNQDPLYILFYNPTKTADVSYNFTMMLKNSKTILLDSNLRRVNINPYEKISFLYYSDINEDQITFDIGLSAAHSEENLTQKYIESALSQGQIIKGRHWAEEETPGPGQEVSFEPFAPKVEYRYHRVSFTGPLSMASSMGKFLIEIANPWEFPVRFGIMLKTPRQGFRLLGENLQYKDDFGQRINRYEILMTKAPAKWYFWVYCCYKHVDVKIEAANKETQLAAIPQGESYLYKENIENKGIEDRFKYVTVREAPWSIYVFSSLIEEEKIWDYEVSSNEKDLEMSLSSNYEENNSRVAVEFNPVEFKDPDPTDKVNYSIEVCQLYSDELTKEYLCYEGSCLTSQLELSVNHKEPITVKIGGVGDGKRYVRIKASVVHKGHVIRFVLYELESVELKSRFWWNFFIIAIVSFILLVLWDNYEMLFKQFYEKMKGRWRKEKND